MVREKITNFLAGSFFTPKVGKLVTGLVRAILKGNPVETLKYLLPQTCERIENIMSHSETTILTDHKGDSELTWCLILFSELVRARGDTLLPYKTKIFSVFHRCVRIIHKDTHEAVASAAKNLLKSLSYVYPIEYRLTTESLEEPFTDFLPIRVSCSLALGHGFRRLSPRLGVNTSNSTNFKFNFMCPTPTKWILLVKLSRRSCTTN